MAAKDIRFSLDAQVLDAAWAHLRGQRPAEAEPLFLQVLGHAPRDARAMYGLAQAHLATGQLEEGIRVARRALKLSPTSAALHATLGLLLAADGQLGRARDAFSSAQRLEPASLAHPLNLAAAQHRLAQFRAAADVYRGITDRAPETSAAWLGLGRVLLDDEQPIEALRALDRARALLPTDPAIWVDLGTALRRLDRTDDAIRALQQAATLSPDPVPAIHAIAATFRSVGRVSEAVDTLRDGLARFPGATPLRVSLAYTVHWTCRDADIEALEASAANADASGAPSHDPWFAVAKVRRDLGEVEGAFDATERANAARRSTIDFQLEPHAAHFADVRRTLSKPPAVPEGDGTAPIPVFVLGMPRSGTSLLEQILASHPDVYGGGELTPLVRVLERGSLPASYPRGIVRARPDDLLRTGKSYLDAMQARAGGRSFVTDKCLTNFLYVGGIRAAIPGARFVHCVRDPRDTCLSIFEQNFDSGMPYAFDQQEVAQVHRLYQEMMEHWHRVLGPGVILDVGYEDLVADVEHESRRILDHVGLEWHPDCLGFHENPRPVQTASVLQVRRPAYTSSVGRWRAVAHRIGPMLEVLGRDEPAERAG